MTSMSNRLTDLDLSNNQLGPLTARVGPLIMYVSLPTISLEDASAVLFICLILHEDILVVSLNCYY